MSFIKSNFDVKGKPIVIYWPGAAHDFVNYPDRISDFFVARLISLLKEKRIGLFIQWMHDWCFIYDTLYPNLSPKKKYQKQISDMNALNIIIQKECPDIEIICLFGNLMSKKNELFELRDITDRVKNYP